MKETGIMTRKVVPELIFMLINKYILVDGLMEKNTVMEYMNIKMVTSTTESGLKTKRTDQEFFITRAEPLIMVNGLMTKHAIKEL